MKVLLLTQVLPYPPDSGPKVKTYNMIKYLSRHHDLTLVSFVRGNQNEHVRQLEQYCRSIHTVQMKRSLLRDVWYMGLSLLTCQPFMMIRDDHRTMRHLVDGLRNDQSFDVVHADQLNMAQYAKRVPNTFKVLDQHNALWLLYKRLWETMPRGPRKKLLERDWRLLKSYEGRLVQEFDAVLAVSREDRNALQEATGSLLDITVVPIAVDTQEARVIDRTPGPYILHIGTMYWPPNIDAMKWFVKQVYPLIREQRTDVQLDIVGAYPPSEIITLSNNSPGTNVAGYVEDPKPYLQRAALTIVPLLAGGGMRVKILDSLARGIPIVSTTLGCEGIDVSPEKDILVADTPEAFAAQVLRVLNDPSLAEKLSTNGRRLVKQKYDYRNALCPLDGVYARAKLARRKAQGARPGA